MKKYIIGLFMFSFILAPWLSFAQVTDIDPNPNTNQCVILVNNLKYRDRDIYKNGEVSTLQDFLQSQNYLNSEPAGYFGLLTFRAVKSFQKANGISPSGYVGAITRAKIKEITCEEIKPNFTKPVISGVSGPQSLNVNETGTWTVSAYDKNGGNLSYSVNWGDENVFANLNTSTQMNLAQSSTFTHSYSQTGTYAVVFTVTNNIGRSATASLSVKVKGVIANSSITVLSPNGGETLYKGNNNMITWQDTSNFNCSNMGGMYCVPSNFTYDIYLNYYHAPCIGGNCSIAVNAVAPLPIAIGVSGTAYNWNVGNILTNNSTTSLNISIPIKYTITVCRSGWNGDENTICDTSDNPFTIQ